VATLRENDTELDIHSHNHSHGKAYSICVVPRYDWPAAPPKQRRDTAKTAASRFLCRDAAKKDDKTRYDIIHEVFDCAFIDKIEQYKYTISIYPKLWNHPLQYTLNTKKNTVFTDVTEDIHQHLIGKFHAIEDGVEVLPVSEEIKCYEERFKAVRNKEKNRYYNVKYCREHKEDNARRQREYRARKKALEAENNQVK